MDEEERQDDAEVARAIALRLEKGERTQAIFELAIVQLRRLADIVQIKLDPEA